MWGSDQQRDTRQRKRDAVGSLRNLTVELGVEDIDRKNPDLRKVEFQKLQQKVDALAQTPEHKRRLKEATDGYLGTSVVPVLPRIPMLTSNSSGQSSVSIEAADDKEESKE